MVHCRLYSIGFDEETPTPKRPHLNKLLSSLLYYGTPAQGKRYMVSSHPSGEIEGAISTAGLAPYCGGPHLQRSVSFHIHPYVDTLLAGHTSAAAARAS